MKPHTRDEILPPGTAVLAVAGDAAQAAAAIAGGAQLVDLWQAGDGTADAVRARYPGIPVCARAGWAELTRDPAAALRTGAMLICADTARAEDAQAAGVDRGALLVEAPPAGAAGLLAAGWAVIVTADDQARPPEAETGPPEAGDRPPEGQAGPSGAEAGAHAAAAVGAIACWLGAAAVRTGHVTAVRRAIAMTQAIRAGSAWRPGGCALP